MTDLILPVLLLLFAWPLLLFPALMKLWPVPRSSAPPPTDDELPPLTLIVCALNEERVIRAKLENCLALDYPPDKLTVVVIDDGSTDGTAAAVRAYEPRGIRLVSQPARRGKAANLNEAAPAAATPIVAFSDANVMYRADALRRLMGAFRDPCVGGATGRVVLAGSAEEFRAAEEQYYSLEWTIHAASTHIWSMAGCDGAMYALRRELFRPVPEDTLIEDFVHALAVVRQGWRMVFVPEAAGWEQGPQSLSEEWRRKVRIAAGAAQCLLRGNGWPVGAPWRFWPVWISHKLLRWLAPFTGLAAILTTAAAPARPLSQFTLAAAAALLLAALGRAAGGRHPVFNAPFYLLFGLAAGFTGMLKGAAGRQTVRWNKANR
jgi:cellulose synthase/poly-beta-1,6-N-acetylglucosamine synthase-like glycosyltransferase